MEANVSAEMLRRWFENGPALPPARRLALLCGHARSGTTLLEQVLDAHPGHRLGGRNRCFLKTTPMPPLKRNSPPNAHMLPVLEAADIPVLQQSRAAYFRSMELDLGSRRRQPAVAGQKSRR